MSLTDKRRPTGGTGSRSRQTRRRRRRPRPFVVVADLWRGLLDNEAFWMVTLLLVGSWILTPPGTFFAPRLEVGPDADNLSPPFRAFRHSLRCPVVYVLGGGPRRR